MHNYYDVIIVGGSYAGLSAAMALGRSMRNVLIIDSGLPCNRQTPQSHNFITQDGETPADIIGKAKQQVLKYDTVDFFSGLAVEGSKSDDIFSIKTNNGNEYLAHKLVFATGIKDVMPDIIGFSECWGISVVHCPYCHGYEYRHQKTAILANGEKAMHLASLVNNLTNDIAILTAGPVEFNDEQSSRLKKHSIQLIETEIDEIEHEDGHIHNVVFRDGSKLQFDVAYAAVPFEQHSQIPIDLGCELTEQGYIKVNHFQKTSTEGIYACGDNTASMRSVANAVYLGNLTGIVVNRELTEERF